MKQIYMGICACFVLKGACLLQRTLLDTPCPVTNVVTSIPYPENLKLKWDKVRGTRLI